MGRHQVTLTRDASETYTDGGSITRRNLYLCDDTTDLPTTAEFSGDTAFVQSDGSRWYANDSLAWVRMGTYITTLGDGVNSVYTITHNLGTKNILIWYRDLTGNTLGAANRYGHDIGANPVIVDDNSFTLDMVTPVAANEFVVMVVKIG